MNFPFNEITKVLEKLSTKYKNINCGGCGVVAYILARQLSKITETKIVRAGFSSVSMKKARKYDNVTLGDWNNAGIYVHHAWVEFKVKNRWYSIDSEGIVKRKLMHSRYSPAKGEFTLAEMRKMICSDDGWNDWFNRNQIKPMKRLINTELNKLFGATV